MFEPSTEKNHLTAEHIPVHLTPEGNLPATKSPIGHLTSNQPTPNGEHTHLLLQRLRCPYFKMSDENISLQSMALQKRTSQTALMPPPPPPKRLKRPPKSLSEEDYTS